MSHEQSHLTLRHKRIRLGPWCNSEMSAGFTGKHRRRLALVLVAGVVLTNFSGCQTFSLTKEDVERQQRGEMVDQQTGDAVGVVGTLGYYGAVIGKFVGAAFGK